MTAMPTASGGARRQVEDEDATRVVGALDPWVPGFGSQIRT